MAIHDARAKFWIRRNGQKSCAAIEASKVRRRQREGEMKSFVSIAVLIFLGWSISGCGSYSSKSSQNHLNLAGTWKFTYVSSRGGSATVSGTLTQTGSNFSGAMTITGSCATSGTISGTISGYALTGTLTETSPETINVTGTVATNYNSVSGTYQVMSATDICAGASGDTGTWSGTRTAVPGGGPYIGMVRPADRMPVQLALTLKNDGSQLSGTVTFTNSACLRSAEVTGTLSGPNLELRGGGGTDGSFVLRGGRDEEGKTLTLNSIVSGACQAESGVGTLTKMQ